MPDLLSRYRHRLKLGRLTPDPAQEAAAKRLHALSMALSERALAGKGSALGWMFARRQRPEGPRGVYLWGGVGRGKSMLMDLFVETLKGATVRRVHFHAFMADVQARLHQARLALREGRARERDPVQPVAESLAGEASVLCFDEFTVTDIADAMILARLFEALFARGVTLVATSNIAPDDLYRDGLNRAHFLPFIALLKGRVDVIELRAARDYRLDRIAGRPVYHTPLGPGARMALDDAWARLTGGAPPQPGTIAVGSRSLALAALDGGVGRTSFDALCRAPLAGADYLALARRVHTLLLDDIPRLRPHERNEARRWIHLIDVLYDENVKLIASAEAEPEELFAAEDGKEAFEFRRTVSRLAEMRSEAYLARGHGRVVPREGGDIGGLVET